MRDHNGDRGGSIHVGALARVEGEGGLEVVVRDGKVTDARLDIYEPPRFFEALLRGRRHTEVPDITSRICGICPIAYQMSACQAIEDACGVVDSRADPGPAPAASTAANGSKATPCTSTCCTRRTSSATKAACTWPRTARTCCSGACS